MAGLGEVVILICAGYVSHRHDGMNLGEEWLVPFVVYQRRDKVLTHFQIVS